MERFVDYLKAHGHLKDLAFMSFEHYPFMVNGFTPPNDWDTALPGTGNYEACAAHVAGGRRSHGRAADYLRERNHAGRSGRGYLGVTGRAIWEVDAFGTFFEQGGTAFYRPAINNGAAGRWNPRCRGWR